jgi:flagellar hook-associated protein 3 FlgL
MRVTSLMIQRQSLADISRVRRDLADTQSQAATGLRVNRPSDDPTAAALASTLRADIDRTTQLERNAARATTRLEVTENALASANDLLARARELAVQASNDPSDGAQQILADEAAALHDELLQLANTRLGGDSLFGGYASGTAPFAVSGDFIGGSPPPTVTFAGDGNEIELEVNDGIRLESTLDGRRVFQGDADGVGGTDPGSEDIFLSFENFWLALQNGDDAGIRQGIADFENAEEQISLERARVGTRLSRLDTAKDGLAEREVQLQAQLSEAQDADTVKVFSDLTLQQVSLEAALQVTSQALQLDLLDFLR